MFVHDARLKCLFKCVLERLDWREELFVDDRAHAANMADVDPETLLEWLQIGQGDERDMQLIALEQLCMLLLMSDNVDRCFERCELRNDDVTAKLILLYHSKCLYVL